MTMPECERREVLEQVQQHRHRDVVRKVRDEPQSASPGSSVTRSASACTTVTAVPGCMMRDRVRQLLGEAVVDLDGDDGCPGLEQPEGQRPETRADLEHGLAGLDTGDCTMRRTVLRVDARSSARASSWA